MRRLGLLLAVAFALPAQAQPLAGLLPDGAVYRVVTVDPATGASTVHGSLAPVAPEDASPAVFVDAARGRAHAVRWGDGGPARLTVDLATGAISTAPWPTGGAFLLGHDPRRDRLIVLRAETDTLGPDRFRHRGVLSVQSPTTGASTPLAIVFETEWASGTYVSGDSLVSNLAGPSVAADGRFVTAVVGADTTRIGAFHLLAGTLAEGPAIAPWEHVVGLAESEVYRTAVTNTQSVTVAGTPVSNTNARHLLRDRLDGSAPADTLARLAEIVLENGHVVGFQALMRAGLAAHDVDGDRLVFNVDGRFRVVDLATGVVTEGAPVPASLRLAARTEAASVVAAETPAGAPALTLAASPNPAFGTVRIALAGADAARVEAFSVLGRRVAMMHDGPVGTDGIAWDVSALPAGVYVVRATTATASAALRVTVAR